MRFRLKSATEAAHERMHGHPGFAAAASGAISRTDYRDLLARLYGFHAAFDAAMARAPKEFARAIELDARARAPALAADLAALGLPRQDIEALPRCEELPQLSTEGDCYGALYVIEGSTLGGVFIAKALAESAADSRRFFLGHGGDHGRMWRRLTEALDRLDDDRQAADAAERSALATFAAFERWMADWRGAARALAPATAP